LFTFAKTFSIFMHYRINSEDEAVILGLVHYASKIVTQPSASIKDVFETEEEEEEEEEEEDESGTLYSSYTTHTSQSKTPDSSEKTSSDASQHSPNNENDIESSDVEKESRYNVTKKSLKDLRIKTKQDDEEDIAESDSEDTVSSPEKKQEKGDEKNNDDDMVGIVDDAMKESDKFLRKTRKAIRAAVNDNSTKIAQPEPLFEIENEKSTQFLTHIIQIDNEFNKEPLTYTPDMPSTSRGSKKEVCL